MCQKFPQKFHIWIMFYISKKAIAKEIRGGVFYLSKYVPSYMWPVPLINKLKIKGGLFVFRLPVGGPYSAGLSTTKYKLTQPDLI